MIQRMFLAAGLFACGRAGADVVTVHVFDYDFSVNLPGQPIVDATVSPGDTVRWLFLDSGHSATSVPGIPEVFDSGYVGVAGTVYEHTFHNPGVWWYYCFPHGGPLPGGTAHGMAGTVTVAPSPGSLALWAACGLALGRRRR